ncbi:MAG: hypothetical protein ABI977_21590, partial [Acidobacteriota bacterium]
QGKPRDEVQVRAAQVRGELRTEDDVGKPFADRINVALIDVDVALRAKKWEDARKQVEQAEELITKWRKYRDDWRRQLDFGKTLLVKIGEAEGKGLQGGENVYLRTLRRNLEDAESLSPDAKSPAELRDKLDKINSDFAKYQAARGRLDELGKKLDGLDAEAQPEWRERLRRLQARLEALTPESAGDYDKLQTDIADASTELQAELPGAKSFGLFGAKGADESPFIQLHLNAPDLLSRELEADSRAARAGWNLRWSSRLLVVLSLALLVGAGYAQLYESKPTFGANFWADYVGLFAWGFGVEASRAAVADWLKGFNLSLWK